MQLGLFAALSGVREDFSDLPTLAEALRVIVRLLVAAVLGGAIGLERGLRGKAAGMRTYMVVAVGAAMFVLVPQQAGASAADLSRVVQGLVAGIGFLGAGAILRPHDEDQAHGLTTAAAIWLTAAIGLAAGMGRESTAVLCTALALVILALLGPVERLLERRYGPPAPRP